MQVWDVKGSCLVFLAVFTCKFGMLRVCVRAKYTVLQSNAPLREK